jgi:Lon protease-like protein
VLLPGELIPLHIFEERYKRMIGRCLEEGEPFGVVLRDSDGARSVGCTAHVAEVLERFEDGRLNVVVSGGTPFRVLDRFDDPEEPAAEVELVDDDEPAGEAPDAEAARTAFADLAEMAAGERPAEDELAEATAYGLAARVELPAETKQELLQMRDEADRMAMLARVLTTLQKALDKAGDLAERAKSNGRVRIGP